MRFLSKTNVPLKLRFRYEIPKSYFAVQLKLPSKPYWTLNFMTKVRQGHIRSAISGQVQNYSIYHFVSFISISIYLSRFGTVTLKIIEGIKKCLVLLQFYLSVNKRFYDLNSSFLLRYSSFLSDIPIYPSAYASKMCQYRLNWNSLDLAIGPKMPI